jgi:sigma-B regulation protein RsbU (phosphoserine phosphatase)
MNDNSAIALAEVRFTSRPDQLKHVRSVIRGVLEQTDCDEESRMSIVLALDEACTNVIRHAYRGNERGDIVLQIERDEDDLVFRIRDFAEPIDRSQVRPRALDDIKPGGLGVHFIHEIMDQATFLDPPDGDGNLLVMRKRIPAKQDSR